MKDENVHEIVNKVGLVNISKEVITKCLQHCRDSDFFYKNRHNNVRNCSFRHECKPKPSPLIGKEVIKTHEKEYFSGSASFPSPKHANVCANYQEYDSVSNANNVNQLFNFESEEETTDVPLVNISKHSS